MLKEEAEKNFNLFYIENLDKTIRYFIYKGATKNDAEELASTSLLGLGNYLTTKYDTVENIPLEEWPRLFNGIKNCRLKDYGSHVNTKKVKNIKSINELGNECEFNETFISEDKTTIQCDNTDELLSHGSIRVVLNSKQASLQNATIIFYTPSFNKLKDVLKNKFSFTEKYYNKYKRTSCYLTYKDKDKLSSNENVTKENLKEMNETFSKIINNLSDKLKINDPVGQEALKIILLSRQPGADLAMRFGYKPKKETFKTIGEIKNPKKYKNRPYLHGFRDFIGYKIKTIRLKKLIFYETKKYPELEVSKEYIEKFYNIGKLNSESLKKQRKGRSNRPGLKQKIDLYENVIKDEIPKIKNS